MLGPAAPAHRGVALVALGAALLVLLPVSLLFSGPGFVDAYYYFHVAANLAAGRGFTEDVIWNYLTDPPALTHPSNLYWMPLPSLLMAPFLAAFGPHFRAAQLPLAAIAALTPACTAWLGMRLWGRPFKSLAAAGLVLLSGYYLVYWAALDAFALFTLAAGGCFLAAGALLDGATGRRRVALAAALGVCAALGHLARADGPLLLLTALALLLAAQPGSLRRRAGSAAIALSVYLLAMSPWFWRNLAVAGTPLPAGGVQTAFLRDYDELFSYGLPLTLERYVDQGLGPLLAGKLIAALKGLGVLFGLQYWLVPFAVVGWRGLLRGRERALFLPPLVYAVALYAVMVLVFTFPSGRGSMLHSAAALLPWLALAAVDGIERTAGWVAARRSNWVAPRAARNFTVIFLAFSVIVSGYAVYDQSRGWEKQVAAYREAAPFVFDARPDAVAMVLNAPGWWYATGGRALQTPSNGPEAAHAAALRYGATHLLLEPVSLPAWKGFDEATAPRYGFALLRRAGNIAIYGVIH